LISISILLRQSIDIGIDDTFKAGIDIEYRRYFWKISITTLPFCAAKVDELLVLISCKCSLLYCYEQEADRVTKDGHLTMKSDKTRLRLLNQADCLDRIRTMIFDAIDDKPKPELIELQAR